MILVRFSLSQSSANPLCPPFRFEILLKQKVGSEDVYLGMSGVTPSAAHCNTMVIRVKMPGASLKDIDLDVTESKITVQSSVYRLSTYLPHPVKHKEGGAKWDTDKDTLTVTLPIIQSDPFGLRGGPG